MQIHEFPAEYFLELKGNEFLLGRLTINKMSRGFWVEVDIVTKDSKKIFRHVGDLHHIEDVDEAVTRSVQMLSEYLK